MDRILITGGAGFTGVNAAARYLSGGDEVVVFDNLSRAGAPENVAWLRTHDRAENLEVVVGDLRNPAPSLRDAVESCDLVVHLAGQVAVTTSVIDPRSDFEINAVGAFNLLEIVRTSQGNRPALFYSSTNKVYGGMEDVETVEGEDRYSYRDAPFGISESRQLDFHSPYGCSKGAADQYVRDYARIYKIPTVVFRQSCIYGRRQFGIEDQGWVAWFTIASILGRKITVFGDGKQVRDVLYVEDLISAYQKAWKRIDEVAGSVFNLGGGPENTISLIDLLAELEQTLDMEIPVTHEDWRPGDQAVYVSDIRKADRELGWRPDTDWREGVRHLIDWVREHQDLLRRILS